MLAYFIQRRRRIRYFAKTAALALYPAWVIRESKENVNAFQTSFYWRNKSSLEIHV